MLHLICGPAHSGKTTRLAELIRSDIETETHCILLVPEQQVYTSEREFPKSLPENAGRYLEILSFTGLSEKLFRRFGGLQFFTADQSVRSLMMWNVLRKLKGQLSRYDFENAANGSLIKLMSSAVEDLRINGISSESLQEVASILPEEEPLRKKLDDLLLVAMTYHEEMDKLFEGKIPEERLLRLVTLLSENKVYTNTNIYVDSFTSFTHDETLVLQKLMEQAKEVTVALCVDQLPSGFSHFASISETGRLLKDFAQKAGISCEKPELLFRADSESDLAYLEENLWKFDAPAYDGEVSHVRLLSARNVYEECEVAAENIQKLVSENGIRYGEIAVVVRDFETYHGWLDAALEKYGIPYFLSERNEFSKKPIARLVLSALRAVLYGYRTQDILSILKTGLSGIPFCETALFEEYVETWRISGKRFLDEEWKMNPDGMSDRTSKRGKEILEAANRVRKKLIGPLQALEKGLAVRTQNSFEADCEALRAYLLEIDLPKTLRELSKEELARNSVRDAEEGIRLFGFLTDLLAKAIKVLGEEQLSASDFLAAMSLLFEASDLGSVPLFNNCVILGSASTLRVENVKAMLVLGLCEGEFPGDVSDGGILTEAEKILLSQKGLNFRSTAELKQSEELFYVYRTFTKPTEMLILSAPKSLGGGKNDPSIAFARVEKLMNRKAELFVPREKLAAALPSTEWEEKQVEVDPAQKIVLSATALRQFANCPYSYHLTKTLALREDADSLQGASESGSFLHYIFEKFLGEKSQDKAAFFEFIEHYRDTFGESKKVVEALAREYMRAICNCDPDELDPQLLQQFERLYEIAYAMLYKDGGILDELKKSEGYLPTAFESKFEKDFPLEDGSGMITLTGKIDRVDTKVDEDGKTHFRVIDYKSHEQKFKDSEISTGKEIQLVLYVMAMLEQNVKWEPSGAKYIYYHNSDDKNAPKEMKFDSSGFTIASSDDATFTTYQENLKSAIQEVSGKISKGYAKKISSKDSCQYCPLKKYCTIAYRKEF